MSLGMRIDQLITSHGDSLRDAEIKTGVSRETIRRLIKGYRGPTAEHHAKQIARGYGVPEKALLEGLDPKGDFEWTITQASPSERLEYVMMTRQERVRLTLDFLTAKYPAICALELLSAASSMTEPALATLLARWESRTPDLATATLLAQGLSRLTGISMSWFTFGWVSGAKAGAAFSGRACQVCVTTAPRSSRHSAQRTQQMLNLLRQLVG